jgi:SPP1 family predicted phage head-tail adaptor
MRNHIVIKQYTSTQDQGGGPQSVLANTYTVWARVENRNGGSQSTEGQLQWNYDYRITIRYDKLKAIKQNDQVEYDGKTLLINSLQIEDEGKKTYLNLRCSTLD